MAELSSDLSLALRIRALVEGQDAIVGLGTSFVELNQRIENLIRGLTAISGSTEGAQREFEYLAEVAQKYGLKILDLSDNYVKLIASSKGTALEGEAVKKVFESVSSAMSVLGGDTITTHRAFTALAQMMSKGQIYSEELKGQLAEAIPGALGIMSRALDISTKDLLALMEAGALGSEVLLPFADQLSQEFGNLATTGRTFTQAVNDLKNTWTLLMRRFEDSSGAFSVLTSGIELLSKSSGALAGVVGAGLAVAFGKTVSSISQAVAATKSYVAMMGVQASAAERSAAVEVESAAARELASRSTLAAAINSENLARANLAAASSSASVALAQRELNIALSLGSIARKEAAAATVALEIAENRLLSSTTLLSKAWRFLAGPGGLILTAIASFAAMAYAFREQDDATKSLAKSTEEYAESLKKMNASALAESIRMHEEKRAKSLEDIEDSKKLLATQQQTLEFSEKATKSSIFGSLIRSQNNKTVRETVEKLEKAESDLAETEAKIAIGRSSLIDKTADIISNLERNRFASEALGEAIKSQREEIDKLKIKNEEGLAVDVKIDASYKNLARLRKEAAIANANLTESQNQYNAAFSDYANRQKELALNAKGTTKSLEDQGLTTDQLSARFKLLTQSQLAATNRVNQLKNALVELTARQENFGTSMRAEIELQERLATATGNTEKQREAAIAKARIEQELSVQGVAIAETTLRSIEEEIVQKKILLETNPKLEKQTSEQIAKLEAQVIAQKAQVAQRIANAKAAAVEAEAAKVAGEVLSKSLERQRSEAAQAQAELSDLRQKYIDMAAAGDGMNELLLVMEMIRAKEKEIADQANNTEIATKSAFKSLGQSFEEVITGMDFETRKAIDALKTLGIQGDLTGKDLRKSMDKAIDLVDSETEIKALIKALSEMKDAGVITSADLGVALAVLQQKLSDLQTGVDPVTKAMEKLGVGVPEKLAAVAEAAKLNFLVIQQSAQPIENVRDAFLEWAKASLSASEAAGKLPDPILRVAAESLGLTNALDALTAAMKRGNPELDKQAERYRRLSDLASDRASGIEQVGRAQLDALETEADYYRAIGATSVAMQKEQEISRRRIEIAKAVTQAKILALRAEIESQKADLARLEYGKASNAIYEQERQAIESKVTALQAEIESLIKLMDLQGQNSKNLAANSDQINKSSEATDQHAESAKKDAEATDEQSKSYEKMEDKATGAVRELSALSKGMNELLSEMLHVQDVGTLFGNQWSGELGELKLALDQTEGAIQHNLRIIGPYAGQFEKNANAANAARKAYLEQAIAATSLTLELGKLSDGVENNASALESLIFEAEQSKKSMGLLDDARLDDLQNAIDSAKDKLRDLNDEAVSARQRIEELNAEIAQEKGDTATADRLKLQLEQQQAIADVERNLAEARDAQNADLIALYETQLSKLDELYRIKEKNLEADIKAQKIAEQQKNAKDKTQAEPQKGQTSTSGTAPVSGPTTINNTFLIDPTKLANEEWVKKNVMPTIEKVGRLRA